ncbi:MAG: hypothetical protein K0R05_3153 [Anaerocolumna sp.]|nr:hypothetical protein [Anaerocolumna sp.]
MNIENKKEMDILNRIYEPLSTKAKSLSEYLLHEMLEKYPVKYGFYNQHYVRAESDWFMEYYPIPVVTATNFCDIGFDLHHIFVEFFLPRTIVAGLDFNKFDSYQFEVYGSENYLEDYYNENMSILELKEKLQESLEENIGITIFLPSDTDNLQIIELINLVKSFKYDT